MYTKKAEASGTKLVKIKIKSVIFRILNLSKLGLFKSNYRNNAWGDYSIWISELSNSNVTRDRRK